MTEGRRYQFKKLTFWAERGLINIVDERFPPSHPQAFVVITVGQFLPQIAAINHEIKRWEKWPAERDEHQTMVENAVKCVKEAKTQGRPDDPKALADMLKARRKNMLYAGKSTGAGAMAADYAPESVVLPPVPNAPENKPFTPCKG